MTSRVFSPTVIDALISKRTFALEWFLGLEALLWGLFILQPWIATFDSLPVAYSVIGWLPEWFVGGFFTLHGSLSCWALWRTLTAPPDSDRRYWVGWCRRAALVSAGAWSLVLTSFLFAAPGSTATPIYLGLTCASAWVYLRLRLRFA
jgi:hypothetical protein